MEDESPVALVEAWQEAANNQDVDRLLQLSHPEIEIVGPRGTGRGHALLRDWLARAGLRLETRRVFARGDAVVVAQHAVWRSAETGVVQGEADVASSFRVEGQRVARVARHESLDAALRDAGLTDADETPRG